VSDFIPANERKGPETGRLGKNSNKSGVIVGDPITVIAGILRIGLLWFVLLVTAGKLICYIVFSYLALQV